MLGPNPYLLREKLRTMSALLVVCYCARNEVCEKNVSSLSYPFDVGARGGSLFVQCIGVTQLISRFLPEGIFLCVDVDLVSVERGEFKSHLCHHLELEPNQVHLIILIPLVYHNLSHTPLRKYSIAI